MSQKPNFAQSHRQPNTLRGWSNPNITNPRLRTAATLKIENRPLSPQRIDRSARNLIQYLTLIRHSNPVKPRPHQQQCRSNIRHCRKDEISTQNSFDIVAKNSNKVERCFNIVAENGNNVAKNGNNVEATFDFVAFDNVASTLLLVWTGFRMSNFKNPRWRTVAI